MNRVCTRDAAVLLGANWNNGSNAGSRASNWNNAPDNSNSNIGSRAACDHYRIVLPGYLRVPGATAFQVVSRVYTFFGKYISRSVKQGVVRPLANIETCARHLLTRNAMGKRYRNLFDQIIHPDSLQAAYHRAAKGRKNSGGYLNFREYEAYNLKKLREQLGDGSYKHGEPRIFTVREPKPRTIAALPFEDRVVQHALHGVIAPIFEAGMMPQSYACREGRGTHSGAIKAQALMRQLARHGDTVYCLKTDYSKYFASIQREPLWRRIEAKISCRATQSLIEEFTPRTGQGIDIGWLTSQLWANVNGTQVDRFLGQTCRESRFLRYMDDLVIFGYDRDYLFQLKDRLERYSGEALGLRFSKWSVQPVTRGVNFLGYRIWPTHKLLRKDSVRRAKRKITHYTRKGDTDSLRRFVASWSGHAQWADTRNLARSLALHHQTLKKEHAHVFA